MSGDLALHNIEAEQALLGVLLVNNDACDRVMAIVRAEDFHDPVHARIFAAVLDHVRDGRIASPVTLKPLFADDPGLEPLGGIAYLVRLAGAAISLFAVTDYARQVADLSRRRDLAAVIDEAKATVADLTRAPEAAAAVVESWSLAQQERGDGKVISFMAAATVALRQANEVFETGQLPGIRSGIGALDDMIGGFGPGQMVVVAGRPGMGKSAVALQFGLNVARRGHGVGFASLEMSEAELAFRAFAEDAARSGQRIPYQDMRLGRLSDEEFEKLTWSARNVADLPIRILPADVRSPGAIFGACQRVAKRFEKDGKRLDLIIVDYLQIMEASSRGNANERVAEMSLAMKAMARRLNVPVVVLAQLSRAVESRDDKRPTLSDLRDSGAIEQDADIVIFPYREEYYLRRQRPDDSDAERMQRWQTAISRCAGRMDLIVAKQRMGPTGTACALFDETTNWLRDTAGYQHARRDDRSRVPQIEGFS